MICAYIFKPVTFSLLDPHKADGIKTSEENTLKEPAATPSKVHAVPDSRQLPSLLFHYPLGRRAAISLPLVKSSPTCSNLKKKGEEKHVLAEVGILVSSLTERHKKM